MAPSILASSRGVWSRSISYDTWLGWSTGILGADRLQMSSPLQIASHRWFTKPVTMAGGAAGRQWVYIRGAVCRAQCPGDTLIRGGKGVLVC